VELDQASEARLVNRLLWTAIALIGAGAAIRLAAQPPSYWSSPRTAIRFDGLPIRSSTNPMFDYFLGRGWLAYLGCVTLFGAAVWLMTAVFPKRLALVSEFTIILGLCYSESTWIAVRWHTGTAAAIGYVALLAIALAAVTAPFAGHRDLYRLRRLCWMMALTNAIDAVLTLIGQPGAYWQNHAIVYEANPASKFFLEKGWWAYAAYILVQIGAVWLLAVRVSPLIGWAIAFAMTLGGFCGGSNWLFFVWRLGLQAPLLYGLLLSTLIVQLVLKRGQSLERDELAANVSNGAASND